MSGFRFSLASLLGVVCAAAVVLGAWRYDANVGAVVQRALTVIVVASATLAGILGSEVTRRRWLPFAIFAWISGAGGWFWWYEWGPDYFMGKLLVEPFDELSLGAPRYALFESLVSLLFGFIGMFVCRFYWKRHPPGSDAERPKRPE